MQPRWAKAMAYFVGVPASLVLLAGAVTGGFSTIQEVSFAVFTPVCLLQIDVAWRAYRRGDY